MKHNVQLNWPVVTTFFLAGVFLCVLKYFGRIEDNWLTVCMPFIFIGCTLIYYWSFRFIERFLK